MFYTIPVRSSKWKQKPSITYSTNVLLLFPFGKTLKTSRFVLSCKREKFTLQDVYIGKLEKCELLNYLITLAKLHIWQSRKQDKIPECEVFLKQVDVKYRTEKYIAVKNNTQKQFQAKWLLYRWHLFIINNSLQI